MEIKANVTKAGLIIGTSIDFARAHCYARVDKLIFMRLCENMVLHWSLPYGVWNHGRLDYRRDQRDWNWTSQPLALSLLTVPLIHFLYQATYFLQANLTISVSLELQKRQASLVSPVSPRKSFAALFFVWPKIKVYNKEFGKPARNLLSPCL